MNKTIFIFFDTGGKNLSCIDLYKNCVLVLIIHPIFLHFSGWSAQIAYISQSYQLDHFYTNKKVVQIVEFLSRLLHKQVPCTMELHFKQSKMTIVRHWAGDSLYFYTIQFEKIKLKDVKPKMKKSFQRIFRNF